MDPVTQGSVTDPIIPGSILACLPWWFLPACQIAFSVATIVAITAFLYHWIKGRIS